MDEQNQNAQQQNAMGQSPKKDKNTGMAVLAYLIFFIPLLTDSKNDPFVKFHVKQGTVLFILGVICWLITNALPVFGPFVGVLLNIALVVLLIIGIMNAVNGVEKSLPYVGQFADKLKF